LARLQASAKGNSRESTLLTADGPVTLGTVDYQAPEQALDFHRADIRADIYSLGCTAYYLLTGKPPFGTGPLAIKLMRHQQAEPPDLKERRQEVPDALVTIVRRMLAKRPAKRYQTPGEVARALEAFSQGKSIPSASSRFGSRRLLIGAAGGLLLLAGLALVLFLLIVGSKDRHSQDSSLTAQPSKTAPNPPSSAQPVLQEVSWVSNGKKYDVATAKVGLVLYIDRTYTITALSPALDGAKLIRASNTDKNVAVADHLKFTLNGPAEVYVAYDSRATSIAAWLNDGSWQRTAETFKATDAGPELARNVYRKRFPAGSVTFGGNSQKPAASAGTHYVVMVRPASDSP
jgi:serine/threonine protein kinase